MLQYLLELDTEVFLFFNRMHHPVMDSIMWFMSGISNWIPLYLVFIALIIKNYQKETWLILLAIALVILAADQITSGFMKPFFERLRPSHEPALDGLVHTVNDYKGGRFGFASGHSSNSFAIATILFLLFRQKYTWVLCMFVWAAVVAYSRIYLGVHYPGDIIVGGLIGVACGWGGFAFYQYLRKLKAFEKIRVNPPGAD